MTAVDEGHRIHGLTPAQVVALIEERDILREALEIQQRLMRPTVVVPRAWRLTPGETKTLMAIRAASPDIISIDRIFSAVYGALHDDPPNSNIVSTRIAQVRKKLGAANAGVVIENVPSLGYRMDLDSAERLDRAIAANRRSPLTPDVPHLAAAE